MNEDKTPSEPQVTEENQSVTLRDALETAYDSQMSEEPKEKEVTEAPKQPKERDAATGKFTKSAPDRSRGGEPKKKADQDALQTKPLPEEASGQIELPPTAPRGLNAKEAEVFSTLPQDLQAAYSRMVDGAFRTHSKKMGEMGMMEKKYRELDSVVAPYEVEWGKAGVTPAQVLNNYLAWEKDFHQNPAKVVGELLAQKGLTPQDLVERTSQIDPEVARLKAEVEQLKGAHSQQTTQSVAEYQNFLNTEIENFRNEAGEDGKAVRPYFDAVYEHMVPIAQAYRNANPEVPERAILEAAYNDAIYLHPQVRERILEEQIQARNNKQAQEKSEKVQRAKLAASSLTGVPSGGSSVNTKPGSLRETLESLWDDMA